MTWEEVLRLAIEKGYQRSNDYILYSQYIEDKGRVIPGKWEIVKLKEAFSITHWLSHKNPNAKKWYETKEFLNDLAEEIKQLP